MISQSELWVQISRVLEMPLLASWARLINLNLLAVSSDWNLLTILPLLSSIKVALQSINCVLVTFGFWIWLLPGFSWLTQCFPLMCEDFTVGVCIKSSLFAQSVVIRCASVCVKVDTSWPESGLKKKKAWKGISLLINPRHTHTLTRMHTVALNAASVKNSQESRGGQECLNKHGTQTGLNHVHTHTHCSQLVT